MFFLKASELAAGDILLDNAGRVIVVYSVTTKPDGYIRFIAGGDVSIVEPTQYFECIQRSAVTPAPAGLTQVQTANRYLRLGRMIYNAPDGRCRACNGQGYGCCQACGGMGCDACRHEGEHDCAACQGTGRANASVTRQERF